MIESHRHDQMETDKASNDATVSSDRLLKMVRDAKGAKGKNPEDIAKQIESNEIAKADAAAQANNQLDQAHSDLNQANKDLDLSEGELANASADNDKLESKARLEREFERARGQFTSEEADVYKQGDKILLRLKGLSFANNKAAISASNFPLLAKVQRVISDVGASRIAVEGHTDSTGKKKLNEILSEKRAESVQSYLISNNNVPADKITAAGYGYSKPIATNKTAEGRAQNRRVDVIITADADE